MSSLQNKTNGRPMENGARRAIDYVNVAYASRGLGTRNFLASIGGTRRITPESPLPIKKYMNHHRSMDSIDGPRSKDHRHRRERTTKSKMKKQLTSTQFDTDSSSLDGLSVSSEMLEVRAKEEEHYNKLKLNPNNLENKRVRKGVSVLYADKINGEIGFRQRTPSGSRMTRPHIIPGRVDGNSQGKPSFLALRNEGHVNSVHSVLGKPISRSSSMLWKRANLPKSYSTGDMCRVACKESTDGASGHGEKALSRRSRSFSEITQSSGSKNTDEPSAFMRYKGTARRYENVDPTNPDINIENVDNQVRLRLRDNTHYGDEHSKQRHSVLRQNTSKPSAADYENVELVDEAYSYFTEAKPPSPYLSPIRSPRKHTDTKLSRLSPQARPADMRSAPLSPLLQPATPHSSSCPITCSCRGIHFIDAIVTIPCDYNGGEYVSEPHDFKIVVPKGAIKKHLTAELQIGVTLQGPFLTPQNLHIVSPIVWVGMRPNTKLKKPLEIKLPHFLNLSQGTRSKTEVFLRASDKINSSNSKRYSKKRYAFKEANDGQGIHPEGHGILLSKHLGLFCIASSKFSMEQAKCCLLPVIPNPIQSNNWKIHYYVTYLLKSCIQMVQRQFGGDWEILPYRKFSFASGKEALEIRFERQLLEAGWILALESSNKILAKDVNLWSSGNEEGITSNPPHFTIRVHGGEARISSMAHIDFAGCSEELSSEIVLPLRTLYTTGDMGTPVSTPTSSLFSPQHVSSQDSAFMTTPITATTSPHITRLGWACHSPSCQCEECTHDYDHLPSAEELGQTHVQLTYHNGQIDLPTDEDLRNIATKVTQCLQGDWTTLQTTLDIPDYIMLDVLSQRSIELQVYRLLKEWRNHAKDCSKDRLAQCLAKADQRLETVSADLLGKHIQK